MPAPSMPTFCGLKRGTSFGPRLARLDRVQVEEERVDHVLRHRADDQLGEVARLDAQRGVEVDLRAFDHRGQMRIRAPGTARASCCLSTAGATASMPAIFGIAGRAAGHLVVLVVPGMVAPAPRRWRAWRSRPALPARRPAASATRSWTRPSSSASRGPNSLLSRMYGCAPIRPSRRVILVMPDAPGIRPSVISGRPNWIFGSSTATR